jgi:uncharacterized repeat protein (TIGR03803 family)
MSGSLQAALVVLVLAGTGGAQAYSSIKDAPTAPTLPTFTSLTSFDENNGAYPGGATLIQATDGNLYGTATKGGINGDGTAFKITPTGTLSTLYSFCSLANCTDGSIPAGGLIQGTDGNFYGVTVFGGAFGYGTVYKMTADGVVTTLHSFANAGDGVNPNSALVQSNGSFYGITQYYTAAAKEQGTVFKITPSGVLTTLYYFCSQANCADGTYPAPGLIVASDGNLYGETTEGGAAGSCAQASYGCGTVFRITPTGTLTTLHSFAGYPTEGEGPGGGLVQARDMNLYGTSFEGGINNTGTAFKITTGAVLTTIYNFCPQYMHNQCPQGRSPYGGLVQGTDGNLYGATNAGGTLGDYGTLYRLTTQGKLTVEHSFDSTDGAYPSNADLVQATDGSFYGVTQNGGSSGVGTVFNLNLGLSPFIETQTSSGKVGAPVVILGTNLSGATAVSFNTVAAIFTVISSSEIKTTVPTGATTGPVVVTTPSGTLTSNKNFRVLQ